MEDIKELLSDRESKLSFLKGLLLLAKCDGHFDDNEKQFYLSAATALELSEDDHRTLVKWIDTGKVSKDLKFASKRQSLFFLKEAVQLCYVDGSYSEKERSFIAKVAKQIGVSKEALSQIHLWVEEGMAWVKRGEALIELED